MVFNQYEPMIFGLDFLDKSFRLRSPSGNIAHQNPENVILFLHIVPIDVWQVATLALLILGCMGTNCGPFFTPTLVTVQSLQTVLPALQASCCCTHLCAQKTVLAR